MPSQALTSSVLMDVSESWIEQIRRSDSADIRLVVDRLCDTPATYSRWLSFHYGLMNTVASSHTRSEQLMRLRKTSFSLLHRQALFEHIRTAQVTGSDREALFAAFHGSTSYAKAVVNEHGRFLESNSSLFCADHLELCFLNDTAFGAALTDYRTQYMEFFAIYCDWVIAEHRGDDFFLAPMIPELKTQLLGLQRRVLAMPGGAIERQRVGGLRFWSTARRQPQLQPEANSRRTTSSAAPRTSHNARAAVS